jgi:succinate-semialdehyde dehydrogenase/glutarate-semialdehyde dehydrogenase
VQVGPLVEAKQRDKVRDLVDDALEKGANAACGGKAQEGPGYFYPPTVLTDVPPEARMYKEEIFGPVAPIFTFADDEDGVRMANDTEYGLVAYAYTRDLNRGIWVSEALETGMVGLNQGMVSNVAAPFGGVKASGVGREGGFEGIEEFLETKYVAINA